MMNEIPFIEKLKIVYEITKSNIFYPIIIVFLLIISFLFITTNKNNSKESKKTYGSLYAIAIIIILIKYADSLKTMADYMMNNLFIIFYFPNIAVYLAAIIITNIIMWISMFKPSTKTIIKLINTTVFSIIHYVLLLILGIITSKKIDVFNQKALYANHNIHALIELSSNIFLIWIIFLIIYKIIYTYLESKKTQKIYEDKPLTVEHIKGVEKESNLMVSLPQTVTKVNAPYIVKREMSKTKIVYELPKQTENTAIYEQMLTLDDYKLLVSLLKEQKEKGIKTIFNPSIHKINNEKVQTEEKRNNTQFNQNSSSENSLSELMKLYKNVG